MKQRAEDHTLGARGQEPLGRLPLSNPLQVEPVGVERHRNETLEPLPA